MTEATSTEPTAATLLARIEALERRHLSIGAMLVVLLTLLKQRRFVDAEEAAAVLAAAVDIHGAGKPQTLEELVAWAKKAGR